MRPKPPSAVRSGEDDWVLTEAMLAEVQEMLSRLF